MTSVGISRSASEIDDRFYLSSLRIPDSLIVDFFMSAKKMYLFSTKLANNKVNFSGQSIWGCNKIVHVKNNEKITRTMRS